MTSDPELVPQTPQTPLVLPSAPRLPTATLSPEDKASVRRVVQLARKVFPHLVCLLGAAVILLGFLDDNSFMFCGGGALVLLGQLGVKLFSPRTEEDAEAAAVRHAESNQVRLLALVIYIVGAGLMLSGYVDHFWGEDVPRAQILALISSGGVVMLGGIACDHFSKRRIDRMPGSSLARISRAQMLLVYLVGAGVILSGLVDIPLKQAPYELAAGAGLCFAALVCDLFFFWRERKR